MNGPGHGWCWVDIDGEHDTWYNIKEDIHGNSPLTGEGAEDEQHEEDEEDDEHEDEEDGGCCKKFTCVELEVYQIWL